MKAVALSLALLLACAGFSHADDGPPATDLTRDAWDALGLEGQWVLYRDRTRDGGDLRLAWRDYFATSGDHELLEWCVLYEGWSGAGARLAQTNAPQWMRAAVWSLSTTDSHSFEDAAINTLQHRPAQVLAYTERYPQVLDIPWMQKMVDGAREQGVQPGGAEGLLPPHGAGSVYAHLAALPGLETLEPGMAAAPEALGTRYVHQVERAMAGFRISTVRPGWVGRQLERLLGHPHEAVRHAGCLTFAALPAELVPLWALLYRAGDPEESARVREAAMFALGRLPHPGAFGVLLDVAADPDHPGWRAAVARLGDQQEPFLRAFLTERAGSLLGDPRGTFLAQELERLAGSQTTMSAEKRQERLWDQVHRSAWLTWTRHPVAEAYEADLIRRVHADPLVYRPAVASFREWLAAEADLAGTWTPWPGPISRTGQPADLRERFSSLLDRLDPRDE